jgi:hypothetical protein
MPNFSVPDSTDSTSSATQDTVDLLVAIFTQIQSDTTEVLAQKNQVIDTLTTKYQAALTQDAADQASLATANAEIAQLQGDASKEATLLANLQNFKTTLDSASSASNTSSTSTVSSSTPVNSSTTNVSSNGSASVTSTDSSATGTTPATGSTTVPASSSTDGTAVDSSTSTPAQVATSASASTASIGS